MNLLFFHGYTLKATNHEPEYWTILCQTTKPETSNVYNIWERKKIRWWWWGSSASVRRLVQWRPWLPGDLHNNKTYFLLLLWSFPNFFTFIAMIGMKYCQKHWFEMIHEYLKPHGYVASRTGECEGGGGASINKPRQRWQPVLIQGSALTIGQPIRPPSTWLDYPRCFHPRFFLGQGLPLPTNQTNQPLLTLFQGGSDPLMTFSGFRSSEQERWWRQIWTSIEMFYSEKAQLSNIWPLTVSNLQEM